MDQSFDAVLFDRDGTLIEDVPYNGDPARVTPMPGALEVLRDLRAQGLRTGVVTNQSGIGRGLLTEMSDLRVLVEAGFIPARWSLSFGFADPAEIVRQASAGVEDPDLAAAYSGLAKYVVADGRAAIYSALTYAGLHGSWLHLGLNCVWLAAFATPGAPTTWTSICASRTATGRAATRRLR